jgi:MFS family permease
MSGTPATARHEWRASWRVVVASFFGISMAGIAITSMGAFIGPLEQAFGWKRAEISSGLTVFAVAGIILGPFLGRMIDRWGPRRFGVIGSFLCGAAFAGFGTVSNSILHWLALWVVFCIAAQVPRPIIWSTAISSEFTVSRGAALAVMTIGSALGGIAAPIVAGTLIAHFGWRMAYTIMGLGWGGLVAVICYFFFFSRLDQKAGVPGTTSKPAQDLPGLTPREAFTSATFAKFAVSIVLANSLYLGLMVHMIPLFTGIGVPRADAIWIVGLSTLAAILAQVICGILADRMPGRYISAVSICLVPVACILLQIKSDSLALRVIPAFLVGMVGGERIHMVSYLTTRYFGMKSIGTIFGVVASATGAGVGLGPLLVGYIYDRTGSYDAILMAWIPLGLLTAGLILWLGRYPTFAKD